MPEGSVPLPLAVRVMDYDWGKKVMVMHTPSPVEYVPLLWVLKESSTELGHMGVPKSSARATRPRAVGRT